LRKTLTTRNGEGTQEIVGVKGAIGGEKRGEEINTIKDLPVCEHKKNPPDGKGKKKSLPTNPDTPMARRHQNIHTEQSHSKKT